MVISKKNFSVVIFSLMLITHFSLLPLYDLSKNNYFINLQNNIKDTTQYIHNSMSDKAKLIGVGAMVLSSVWLVSKLAKNAIVTAMYAGGLYATVFIGNSLLKDVKDPNDTLAEMKNDIKEAYNHREDVFEVVNEMKNEISDIIKSKKWN